MRRRPKDDKPLIHVLLSPLFHALLSTPKKRGRSPKRKQTGIEVGAIVTVALLFGAAWLALNYTTSIFLLFAAGIAAFAWFKIQKKNDAKKRAEEIQQCIERVVNQHIKTLTIRRSQAVYQDPYGREVTAKWDRELAEFIAFHIMPALPTESRQAMTTQIEKIGEYVESRVISNVSDRPRIAGFSEAMTPTEFEQFCAAQLRSSGWDARVTQASGDQGVDVIATKNGKKLVVQCKLYGRPVGNKAVQEISAARLHEAADFAAVVSNQRYTPAACRLAQTNGVALLHFSEMIDDAITETATASGFKEPPPFR